MKTSLAGCAIFGALLVGVVAGCGGSDESTAADVTVELPDTPMSDVDAAAIDRAVSAVYTAGAQKEFPGLWVGVWDPKKGAFTQAYGEAEKGSTPATTDDVFRIGSITKTFTGTVILELIDEGKVALSDTVADAAPDVAKAHPEVADITLERLLGMTSGIPDYFNVQDGEVAPKLSEDPAMVFTADELISAGIDGGLQPVGTPGYSTTNYIILQEIAEEVTGESIQGLVSEKVTGPLGTPSMAFPDWDDPTLASPGSHGYLNAGCAAEIERDGGKATVGTDTTDWNLTSAQGGGGTQSTLHDLGVWAASMSGSALLSKELASKRIEHPTDLPEGLAYGLAIFKLGSWWGHSGEWFGWEAIALHDPETGATVAMAANACNGATNVFLPIISLVYAGTIPT